MCWMSDADAIHKNGFFQGYNNIIWVVVLLQVCNCKFDLFYRGREEKVIFFILRHTAVL